LVKSAGIKKCFLRSSGKKYFLIPQELQNKKVKIICGVTESNDLIL
jgi:hypothetical protein